MKTIVENEKNEREIQILQLQKQADDLKKELLKQRIERFKKFNIRNLKIVAKTGRFLLPFVVSTALISSIVVVAGGGLPLYVDTIKRPAAYSLEYTTDGEPYIIKDFSYKSSSEPNELIIFTPWELVDGQYVRYKRVYNFSDQKDLKLLDAILEENHEYISENVKDFKEEKQVTNNIPDSEENDYYFQAKVYILDEEDILQFPESKGDNTFATIFDLGFGTIIGALAAALVQYDYLYEIRKVNKKYYIVVKGIKDKKRELKEINQKILSLSKGGEI